MTLDQVIAGITPADMAAMERAKARWDSIAKPLGSLGLLEEEIVRVAGMTGSPDVDLSRRAVVAMCADNGVVAEGVTQTAVSYTHLCGRRTAPSPGPGGSSGTLPRSSTPGAGPTGPSRPPDWGARPSLGRTRVAREGDVGDRFLTSLRAGEK